MANFKPTMTAMKESNGNVTFYIGVKNADKNVSILNTSDTEQVDILATKCAATAIDKYSSLRTLFGYPTDFDKDFEWIHKNGFLTKGILAEAIGKVKFFKNMSDHLN